MLDRERAELPPEVLSFQSFTQHGTLFGSPKQRRFLIFFGIVDRRAKVLPGWFPQGRRPTGPGNRTGGNSGERNP
jgi:hypothetical protein